jgi:hypothetical protein
MPAFFHLEHRVSSAIEGSGSSKTNYQPYLPAAFCQLRRDNAPGQSGHRPPPSRDRNSMKPHSNVVMRSRCPTCDESMPWCMFVSSANKSPSAPPRSSRPRREFSLACAWQEIGRKWHSQKYGRWASTFAGSSFLLIDSASRNCKLQQRLPSNQRSQSPPGAIKMKDPSPGEPDDPQNKS